MSERKPVFPASRLADWLGIAKASVLEALKNEKPVGEVYVVDRKNIYWELPQPSIVCAQTAAAWSVAQLKPKWRRRLYDRAKNLGYAGSEEASIEQLLADAPKRFVPRDRNGREVAVADVAEHCIEHAQQKRRALSVAIDQIQARGNWDPDALQHYRREIGCITERRFYQIIEEILMRDVGEQRFDDIALYLPSVVSLKAKKTAIALRARTEEERHIEEKIAAIRDLNRPTANELNLVWVLCFAAFDNVADRGADEMAEMKKRIVDLLYRSGLKLPANRDSARRQLDRKYSRWIENGRVVTAIEDGRFARAGYFRAPVPTAHDLKLLKACSALQHGGRIDQGWQRAYDQLSEPIRAYYTNRCSAPRRIRQLIRPDVVRVNDIVDGEHSHKVRGAHHTRDYSNMLPADWYQGDDVTIPCYFYIPNERGWFDLTRGQWLLMVDVRTDFILGGLLIPERSYKGTHIRSLVTATARSHGLPRKGYYFERGAWQSGIIAGRKTAFYHEVAERGLTRFNLTVRKALGPRSKVIERTIGKLQDQMEGWPGYCGRNETTDTQERFKNLATAIKAARVDPSRYLYSFEQMNAYLQNLIEQYNNRPQFRSRRLLPGQTPAEAWKRAAHCGEPRVKFDRQTHYFLASEIKYPKVTKDGIKFEINGRTFRYKGEGIRADGATISTGSLVHEHVYAWFDAADPDILPCTKDLNGSDLFFVERSFDLPADEAPAHLLANEEKKARDHQAYGRGLYQEISDILPAFAYRAVRGREVTGLGENIEQGRRAIRAQRTDEEKLERKIAAVAKEAHYPAIAAHQSPEALEALRRSAARQNEIAREVAKEDEEEAVTELQKLPVQ